jgi:hypothetical protein
MVVVHFEQTDAGTFGSDVDEDERDFTFGELIEQRLFDAEGHDGNTFDFALEHAANAVGHALGVVVGGADEDLVAVLDGDIFKALDEFGEEGVGDLGDDETEEAAAAGDEGAGLSVGEVVELVDDLPYAFGDFGIDGYDVIDGARDGGNGDVGSASNGADVHALRRVALDLRELPFFTGHSILEGVRFQHSLCQAGEGLVQKEVGPSAQSLLWRSSCGTGLRLRENRSYPVPEEGRE